MNAMNVCIRTDASVRLGTGHLMRCLALAQALRRHGAGVTFLMRDVPAPMAEMLRHEGFALRHLGEASTGPADPGAPWETDARDTAAALAEADRPDWLVIDHYGLDERWEKHVRRPGLRLLVIDDLARCRHDCDALLNQNLLTGGDSRYQALLAQDSRLLCGPRFALLREEFRAARASLRRNYARADHLLVSMGGTDPGGICLKVLEAVDAIRPSALQVTAIVGAASPHRDVVEQRYGGRKDFRVIHQATDMAKLMAQADIAVGAGGTSVWERCCVGLPAVVIPVAENQLEVGRTAADAGACLLLESPGLADGRFAASLSALVGDSSARRALSEAGMTLVDGDGARRVAKVMLQRPLRVRPARPEDAERVYQWRNAEPTRRHARDPRPFSLEEHRQWFGQSLANADRILLIGESDGGPLGVLRYDIAQGVATVSIYLDPARHGLGYGPSLLTCAERWLRRFRPEVNRLRAEIRPENARSRSAFVDAGFQARGSDFERPLQGAASHPPVPCH